MILTHNELKGSAFVDLFPSGYFRRYMDKMLELNNECPLPFHFLSMAVVLGNMIGYSAWCRLARGVDVYPNINAFLVSPAGKCRRGEGTKLAMKVARLASVRILEGKATAEGLADMLVSDENLILYVEELSVMFTKRDYQKTVIPFLTKALLNSGGPLDEVTRGGGHLHVPRANLSAILTTAPDWVIETMPEEAHGGGLTSRFIMCVLLDRDVTHVDPNAEGDDKHVWQELSDELALIRKDAPQGHVKLDEDAATFFKEWYVSNETRVMDDERMEPHRNRAPANVLRMALLLAVSNSEVVISKERLEQAIAVLRWFEVSTGALYGWLDSAANPRERALIRALSRKKELTHAEAMSVGRMNRKEFAMVMGGLLERGMVVMKQRSKEISATNYPPMGWLWVDPVTSKIGA